VARKLFAAIHVCQRWKHCGVWFDRLAKSSRSFQDQKTTNPPDRRIRFDAIVNFERGMELRGRETTHPLPSTAETNKCCPIPTARRRTRRAKLEFGPISLTDNDNAQRRSVDLHWKHPLSRKPQQSVPRKAVRVSPIPSNSKTTFFGSGCPGMDTATKTSAQMNRIPKRRSVVQADLLLGC